MNRYLNQAGLGLSAIASLYLTSELFLSMATGFTALVFLAIGVSAEIGKYQAIYAVGHSIRNAEKFSAVTYGVITTILILVSLAGSAGALLSTDVKPSAQLSSFDAQIADIDRQIAIEEKAMSRASDVNAQTAGVAPARDSLSSLRKDKKQLLDEKAELPIREQTVLDAIVVAVSNETGVDPETVRRVIAFCVALLLEGLCLLFASSVQCTEARSKPISITGSGVTAEATSIATSDDDRFPMLVAAIKNNEMKPTYDNIRQFMKVGAGSKVDEIKQKLVESGVAEYGSRGMLVPV